MVFSPADILLPKGQELTKWAVIACDQFSSEREYWERVDRMVGNAPSTLRLIVPEVYLEDVNSEDRTAGVGRVAQDYLSRGIFEEHKSCFVYTRRTLRDGRVRCGIVGALDLDCYDFTDLQPGESKIGATEQTVPNRLPARSKARSGSPLEAPHIMALIDDPTGGCFELLAGVELPVLYDFELMENSGRLTGYLVEGQLADEIATAVEQAPDGIKIGDGNHSLAAAKSLWETIKQAVPEQLRENHPARYALAELNNVYDSAIDFHAIHRVVFDTEPERFIKGLISAASGNGSYVIKYETAGITGQLNARNAPIGEIIDDIQKYIDSECEKTGCTVDYIHGDESFSELSSLPGRVGIQLPAMDKADLFRTVKQRGVFPRKSFSIGEAWDKRFYMECRKIK